MWRQHSIDEIPLPGRQNLIDLTLFLTTLLKPTLSCVSVCVSVHIKQKGV